MASIVYCDHGMIMSHKCIWCDTETFEQYHDDWYCSKCVKILKYMLGQRNPTYAIEIHSDVILRISYKHLIKKEDNHDFGWGTSPIEDPVYEDDPENPELVKIFFPVPTNLFISNDIDKDGSIDPHNPKVRVLIQDPTCRIVKAKLVVDIKNKLCFE